MSSLNKRYCKACGITAAIVLILIFLPVFNYHKQKEIKESVHQNAEIAFVTVKKKAPAQQKREKKAEKKPESTIPSDNPAEKIEEETEEEVEEQEEITAEEAAAVEKATSTYKEYVLSRISAKKVYPMAARAKGQTGRVKMHITIQPDGTVSFLEITRPTPYELLNDAAMNAVNKAAPFKKMPDGMKMKALDFVFAMDFMLE